MPHELGLKWESKITEELNYSLLSHVRSALYFNRLSSNVSSVLWADNERKTVNFKLHNKIRKMLQSASASHTADTAQKWTNIYSRVS